ncbi:hypothetical protein RF11_01804 [Thelohanellus kitauei]|uniref:Uncharacterized protein n=1 Tax=Thelohanellus kitauei TaxID=669202 RepID=A0A0C2NCZ6_THEKT|nr:hypothetical protein RF11_01804 [Thelohanellus kitauei]
MIFLYNQGPPISYSPHSYAVSKVFKQVANRFRGYFWWFAMCFQEVKGGGLGTKPARKTQQFTKSTTPKRPNLPLDSSTLDKISAGSNIQPEKLGNTQSKI